MLGLRYKDKVMFNGCKRLLASNPRSGMNWLKLMFECAEAMNKFGSIKYEYIYDSWVVYPLTTCYGLRLVYPFDERSTGSNFDDIQNCKKNAFPYVFQTFNRFEDLSCSDKFDVKTVMLDRDIVNVVESFLLINGFNVENQDDFFCGTDLQRFIRVKKSWYRQKKIRPDFVNIVKYDDLKDDTFNVLCGICDFFDMGFDDDVLKVVVGECTWDKMSGKIPAGLRKMNKRMNFNENKGSILSMKNIKRIRDLEA